MGSAVLDERSSELRNLHGSYAMYEEGKNHSEYLSDLKYKKEVQILEINCQDDLEKDWENLNYVYHYYIVKEGNKQGLMRLAVPTKNIIEHIPKKEWETGAVVSEIIKLANQRLIPIKFTKDEFIIKVEKPKLNKHLYFDVRQAKYIGDEDIITKSKQLTKYIQ
ncbi:MAG: hypothetical protein GX247_05760 [Mollicutes bacterium]|nr:hypothetical protein [Mollicutes bacterium]